MLSVYSQGLRVVTTADQELALAREYVDVALRTAEYLGPDVYGQLHQELEMFSARRPLDPMRLQFWSSGPESYTPAPPAADSGRSTPLAAPQPGGSGAGGAVPKKERSKRLPSGNNPQDVLFRCDRPYDAKDFNFSSLGPRPDLTDVLRFLKKQMWAQDYTDSLHLDARQKLSRRPN